MNKPLFYSMLLCFVMGSLCTVSAQAARQSLDYEGVVRKNLELRKRLQELEKKYGDLENERKVLILHVQGLQNAKDFTSKVIQNLQARVETLRIEMAKDPKLTKVINALSQKIDELTKEKSWWQKRMDMVESEKEKMMGELDMLREPYAQQSKKGMGKRLEVETENRQLREELEAARAGLQTKDFQEVLLSLKMTEALLKEEIQGRGDERKSFEKERLAFAQTEKMLTEQIRELENIEGRLKSEQRQAQEERALLEGKLAQLEDTQKQAEISNQDLAEELEVARLSFSKKEESLNDKIEELSEEKMRLQGSLKEEQKDMRSFFQKTEKPLKAQVRESEREKGHLEKELVKIKKKNRKLEGRLVGLEEEAQQNRDTNRQIVKEFEGEQKALKKAEKDLKTEIQKRSIENENFEQKLKRAIDDRQMFEDRAQDAEARSLAAETKLGKVKKDLEEKTARAGLWESEVVVLKEEKSKLEEKLVRYIEKIIERDEVAQRSMIQTERVGPVRQKPSKDQERRLKEETAQQKLNMHYNLAIAYDRRGMYKEERGEYLKCLKINPKDANVHYNLGILYDDKLNKNKKAIVHYKKFLALRPIGEESEQVKDWILRAEQESRLGVEAR